MTVDSSGSFVVAPAQLHQGKTSLDSLDDRYARPTVVVLLQMLAACEVVGLYEERSFDLLRTKKTWPAAT